MTRVICWREGRGFRLGAEKTRSEENTRKCRNPQRRVPQCWARLCGTSALLADLGPNLHCISRADIRLSVATSVDRLYLTAHRVGLPN